MDDEPESFIDQMTREVTLNLSASGGRVFVHSADQNQLDRCVIELKCSWSPGLAAMFSQSIHIGDDRHKPTTWNDDDEEIIDEDAEEEIGWSLIECPIMLTIYSATADWVAAQAAKNESKPVLGSLTYYEPDKPGVDAVNYKRPLVTAWVGLGPENFELLRNRLLEVEKPDFDLGIAVEFPRGSVTSGWTGKDVKWDGKGSLAVTSATLVWLRADWNSETARTLHVPNKRRERESEESEPPREHVQLMDSIKRLEVAVTKLTLPVWLAAGAAIIALVATR